MRIDDGLGPLVELAASRHNAFHSSEAAEIGINSRRLRRAERNGILRSLHPKVWGFSGIRASPQQAIRGATIALPLASAAYQSAAWLYGWIDRPSSMPHVLIGPQTRARLPGASVHRVANVTTERDICKVNNIRTLNKAATLVLLGATADRLIVEKCLDEYLRSDSETWLDETFARLWTRTSKGPRVLEQIRNSPRRVEGVTESWLERVVADLVNQPSLPPVVLQHPVVAEGRRFRLDIACPDLMLGVEAHGRSFHYGKDKEDADNVRDLLIGTLGWKLIYVTYSQSRDPDEFVRLFTRLALTRARQLGVQVCDRSVRS
jgi:hypothetical protein